MATYYYTTGFGILITDTSFEQYHYSKGFLSPDYLQYLGFHELKDFITQIATKPVEEETSFFHTFYTSYTSNDIIYNFLLLDNGLVPLL